MAAKRTLGVLVLSIFGLSLYASDIPVSVENSGSKEVDALVVQLVSTRPAPHPSGYDEMTAADYMALPYMTAQVSNAIVRLKAMGPAIFPALVTHLRDDRYSFSDIIAAWDNLKVRDAVVEVLCDGHYMFSGYKFRDTPSGTVFYLSFGHYLHAKEPAKWAQWAKAKSRLAILNDFIDWCISKEEERGFTDENQRNKLLARYAKAREEVRKEYSEKVPSADRDARNRKKTDKK